VRRAIKYEEPLLEMKAKSPRGGLVLLAALCAWPALAQNTKLVPVQPYAFALPAPALAGEADDWLNTGGKKLEFQKGRVYVVGFWTYGCINCQRNLPSYARWQNRFARKQVTLLGIHTPETDAEKKRENVIQQVKKLGITYPVLLDPKAANWKRWEQRCWPTVYLVDKRGQVRYRWLGELDWQHAGGEAKMAACVEQLLREP
jgi:thiol-disulfide isomerase/thioredoxin